MMKIIKELGLGLGFGLGGAKAKTLTLTIVIIMMLGTTCVRAEESCPKCPKCQKWGNQFDVLLQYSNIERDCKVPGHERDIPVCCAAVNTVNSTRGVGLDFIPDTKTKRRGKYCVVTKEYFSSPLELYDLALAHKLRASSEVLEERLHSFMTHVTSPETIDNSTKWLKRIKIHMESEETPTETQDDKDFLSRFVFTRTCNSKVVEQWIEYIEPLTIHARHPFSFATCLNPQRKPYSEYFTKGKPRVGRSNVDYVLVKSGKNFYNEFTPSFTSNGKEKPVRRQRSPRHYMFDAGTSTFDSSLVWFTCAYSQRKMGFDQVYGWEMTLLEPTDYWKRVPPNWKPYWHFSNVPISSEEGHPDNPLRIMQQVATPQDFVSFKLDIDTPAVELPIAIQLLQDPKISNLIDEFFFELHFRCEVMTSCGWGKRVPAESHGFTLERPQVLQFFLDLRRKGIRAHIWP